MRVRETPPLSAPHTRGTAPCVDRFAILHVPCRLVKNLALTGFEKVTMIDLDTIDYSNLNRQVSFEGAQRPSRGGGMH